MSKPAKMRVVIVEPGQYAREAEIDNTLQAKQAVVGGLIDAICPWPEDKACLILNDEGKLIPLPLNRALPEYEDVVFGTFFICGDDGEDFCSLTDEQVQRYLERFRQPELLLPYHGHVLRVAYDRPDLPGAPDTVRQAYAARRGLPEACFASLKGIEEVMMLRYGERRYLPLGQSPDGKTAAQYADELNDKIGVTREQQLAMLQGTLFGWEAGQHTHTDKKHLQDMTR